MTWDFKTHYQKNKEEINRKRRAKYHSSDQEYRDVIISKAKERYHRLRQRETPIDRRTIVASDGTRYWAIGRVSRLIGRTILTIRQYHKTGILPEPKRYDTRGWRLYDYHQVNLLRQVFRRLDDKEDETVKSLADVKKILHARWEAKNDEKGENS